MQQGVAGPSVAIAAASGAQALGLGAFESPHPSLLLSHHHQSRNATACQRMEQSYWQVKCHLRQEPSLLLSMHMLEDPQE
jgi:hypothetical protein